jgi:hypothetical protein
VGAANGIDTVNYIEKMARQSFMKMNPNLGTTMANYIEMTDLPQYSQTGAANGIDTVNYIEKMARRVYIVTDPNSGSLTANYIEMMVRL